MRAIAAIVLAICSLWFVAQPASAEKRVALIIGNSSYQNVTRLTNPANDAAVMTETLKGAGFDVVEFKRDLKANDMRRALRDFSDNVRDADIAVVYYAGHGMEIDGTNYVIPVDAVLERDIDAFDEAIPLDRILTVVEPARQLRLVILDACRDNPFAKTMKRTIGSRAVGRGLAKVEPASPNTLIAYASKAGSTASDGDSKNSPFTTALVKHIATPGLDLRKAFGFVRDDVLKNTSNRQEPYVYGSLGGDDFPLVPAKPIAAPAATPSGQDAMRRDYELALAVGSTEVWDAYIANYPSGFYTALAKAQRKKSAAEEARLSATEKARLAEEEKARLVAEGAKKAEQEKAAAAAKIAEKARVAAELAKKAEDAKLAEAERAKAAAIAKAAEAAMVEAERAKAAEAVKATADAKISAEQKAKDEKVAALTQPVDKSDQASSADIPRALQSELRRVGCNAGSADGNWNAASQRSLDLFNKHAGMKLDIKVASVDALDAVKSKTARVCPLICDHGYRADGERCVKISCGTGMFLNEDNECEKKREREKPTAKREEPRARPDAAARSKIASPPPTPQASGQIVCNHSGCRPVQRGCRLAVEVRPGGSGAAGGSYEVCN
jgi:uncharacterized caspase-like protein